MSLKLPFQKFIQTDFYFNKWLPTYGYLPMATYLWLPTYGYLPMATSLWLPTYGYLPLSTYVPQHAYPTYVNIPSYIYLLNYTNLCQPTVYYLPIFTNPLISIYKCHRPRSLCRSCSLRIITLKYLF